MNNHASRTLEPFTPDVWPADLYIISYLLFLMVMVCIAPGELAERGNFVFEMTLLILLSFLFATGVKEQGNVVLYYVRSLYHLVPILYSFRLLHFLIPAVRNITGYYERLLITWDQALFGTHVPLYFQPIRTPLLTELMYYFYASYYIVPPVIVTWIFYKWTQNQLNKRSLQKVIGGLALGFISSYLVYMIVPGRGPWYALGPGGPGPDIFSSSLESAWYGEQIRTAILTMEMEMYSAFPSGHMEVYLISVIFAWKYARSLFWPVLVLFLGMALSTMYLRFHYGVDLLAGGVLGFFVVWFQEVVH